MNTIPKFITPLHLLTLFLLLNLLACQRNNMPYGGAKDDEKKLPYTQQFDVNSQNNQK